MTQQTNSDPSNNERTPESLNTPEMMHMKSGVATFDCPVVCQTLGDLRLALAPYGDGHKIVAGDPIDLSDPAVLVTLVKTRRGDVLTMTICLSEAES